VGEQSKDKGNPSGVSVRDEDFEPGRVKFVHHDGYGFIERLNKSDVYFHTARVDPAIAARLKENVEVMVAVGTGKRGANALMIRINE
jgi:cold shock CspA family protein